MEALLSTLLDVLHALHCHDGLAHQVSIVLDRAISSLFELERGIDREFFAARFAVSLRPGDLAGVAFFVEVAMAFGTAKSERFRVVTHEHDTMAGVARRGAEVTFFDAHCGAGLLLW